jgi:hypothetical protein
MEKSSSESVSNISSLAAESQSKDSPKNTLINHIRKNRKKISLALGIIVLLVIIGLLFFKKNLEQIFMSGNSGKGEKLTEQTLNNASSPANSSQEKPKDAIAKVGDEYIFQTDLDVELANYPGTKDEVTRKQLLTKLVNDSIAIQAAGAEKILAINPAVFNTPGKDYGKRIADLKAIKSLVNKKTDHLSGTIVNVWFNNYEPAKIGLEAGKKLAFERISALQKRVAGKEITIEEAGNIIRRDPSYADLDVGYKVNASFQFSQNKGGKITFNPDFDQNLWRLNSGGVSDVYLGSIVSGFTNKSEEAFYAFGQVTEKVDNGNSVDYEKWLKGREGKYEVTYY